MLEFFLHFIVPKSPARAKLAIHLLAQGMSAPRPVEDGTVDMLKIDSKPAKSTINEPVSEPYLIKNIRDFRSLLTVSAGPQPVKDFSEFEQD
jgi:insulysin